MASSFYSLTTIMTVGTIEVSSGPYRILCLPHNRIIMGSKSIVYGECTERRRYLGTFELHISHAPPLIQTTKNLTKLPDEAIFWNFWTHDPWTTQATEASNITFQNLPIPDSQFGFHLYSRFLKGGVIVTTFSIYSLLFLGIPQRSAVTGGTKQHPHE